MNTIFGNLLTWIVQFALYVPFQLIRLIGLLLPPCSDFGITTFSTTALQGMTNWIRFLWPIIQYLPWGFCWNYLSAVLLYIFAKWLFEHLVSIINFVVRFWWIVVALYVLGAVVDTFIGVGWRTSSVFTEVLGGSVTGTVGGGFGGGGGGSW